VNLFLNNARHNGGAVFAQTAELVLHDTILTDNQATNNGGAYNAESSVSTFHNTELFEFQP
jgi:predicted outer membrane repeat protein